MNQAFAYYESEDFRMRCYALNTLASFCKFVEKSNFFEVSKNAYSSNAHKTLKEISNRIRSLLDIKTDEAYMHVYDSAIAAYIYIIFTVDPSNSTSVFKDIEDASLKNLWWTDQIKMSISSLKKPVPVISENISFRKPADSSELFTTGSFTVHNASTIIKGQN